MNSVSQNQLCIDRDTSRAITGVRFFLILLVVFIHNVPTEVNFAGGAVTLDVPPAVAFVRDFISGTLGRIAVPTFFFISAYLLFKKGEPYPLLLKKKARSLLVPYLLWNALITLAFFVCQKIPVLRQYFATLIISDLDAKGWLGLFIGFDNADGNALLPPIVYQFWFLRDLLLCIAVSPLIKKAVEKMPLAAFFAVLIFLYMDVPAAGMQGALFYFSLGCFAANRNLNYASLEKIRTADSVLIFVLAAAAEYAFRFANADAPQVLHSVEIIAGGMLVLKISGIVCRNEKAYRILKYFAGFSFWLYATHDPFLITPIKKLWTRFLPINGFWLLAEYFGGVLLCVMISLAAGIALRRLAPKAFALLTGGRG